MKKNIKIASQRGVLTLEASILMTVFAIAAIGVSILLTAYLPATTRMWIVTSAQQLCHAQNGTFRRNAFLNRNCGEAGQRRCCRT